MVLTTPQTSLHSTTEREVGRKVDNITAPSVRVVFFLCKNCTSYSFTKQAKCIEKRLAAQALGAERKEKFQQKFIQVSSRHTLLVSYT